MKTLTAPTQAHRLSQYYKWHAPIYDATRWSFLFGRGRLIRMLPRLSAGARILEVGCGTGRNLKDLARRYPEADLTGIDLAEPMLRCAERQTKSYKNVHLIHGKYGYEELNTPFDLILLSYSLTMMAPSMMRQTMTRLQRDLASDGRVAVVDFHRTPLPWFHRWMGKNHVKMNGRLFERLKKDYRPIEATSCRAYLGLWSYFLFLGQPRQESIV